MYFIIYTTHLPTYTYLFLLLFTYLGIYLFLDDDEPEFTNLLPVPFDINEHEIEIADNNEVLAVPLDPPVENIIEVVNDASNWGFESSDDENELFQNILPAANITGQLNNDRLNIIPPENWLPRNTKPHPYVFTGTPHITNSINSNSNELDCFKIFFSDSLIKLIKKETNRYAFTTIKSLKRRNLLKKKSVWHKWKPVTLSELKNFFSIIVHMSLVEKPHIKDYWSTNPILYTPFASSLMKRDRFTSIFSMLHISNNSKYVSKGQPGHDSLFKIRSYVNFINTQMSKSYYPDQNITVDEGVCPFRGRVNFRVYMKNKPEKYGMKLYVASDPLTGYTLKFEIYSGKGQLDNSITSLYERLLCDYFEKGHTIYMDRFYTSPLVLKFLWEKKTNGVGTVMANRKGLPKQSVVNCKLNKGEMTFARNGPQICIKWKDTRDVLLLSTVHSADMKPVTVKARGGAIQKFKPVAIIDYNKNKTGVDHGDQLITYYPFKRKTLKWWKKMFFHLFKITIVNSFILFKKIAPPNKTLSLKNFMLNLAQQLCEIDDDSRNNVVIDSNSRLKDRHFITRLPSTPSQKNPRRKCKVCMEKIKKKIIDRGRKETSFYCATCNIPLCIESCFEAYHTKNNYWE